MNRPELILKFWNISTPLKGQAAQDWVDELHREYPLRLKAWKKFKKQIGVTDENDISLDQIRKGIGWTILHGIDSHSVKEDQANQSLLDKKYERNALLVVIALVALFLFGVWQCSKPKPPTPPTPFELGWNEGRPFGHMSAKAGYAVPRKVELREVARKRAQEAGNYDPDYQTGFIEGFKYGYKELTEKAW